MRRKTKSFLQRYIALTSLITPTDIYNSAQQVAIGKAFRTLGSYVLYLSTEALYGFGTAASVKAFLADPKNKQFASDRKKYWQFIEKFAKNATGFGQSALDSKNNRFFVQIIEEGIAASKKVST